MEPGPLGRLTFVGSTALARALETHSPSDVASPRALTRRSQRATRLSGRASPLPNRACAIASASKAFAPDPTARPEGGARCPPVPRREHRAHRRAGAPVALKAREAIPALTRSDSWRG